MNGVGICGGNSTYKMLRQELVWCLEYSKEASVERWVREKSAMTHEVGRCFRGWVM